MVERSAVWMAHAVRERKVSALELFDAHAARIAERDPEINALVLPRGDAVGPLHGVPSGSRPCASR